MAPKEEAVFVAGVFLGDGLDFFVLLENFAHLIGQGFKGFDDLGAVAKAEVAKAPEVKGDHGAEHDLRGEGLSGGDADFGAGVLVDAAVGFAGNGGAHAVVDREGAVAFAFGFAQGGEGVDSFAGLADREDEGVFVERGVAVTEFGSVFDFDWDAGEALDEVFRNEAGMPGGATGKEKNTVHAEEFLGG